MILKRRQDTSENYASIDIQVILNDDFYIQQTACLNELIYEKYEILFSKKYNFFNFKSSGFYTKTLWTIYSSTTVRIIQYLYSKISL